MAGHKAWREIKRKGKTQTTAKGLEIPVPKRTELMDAFRKIVRPVKKP